MKMIPPRPPDTSTGSERKVFSALAAWDAGPDAAALTSLNLSRHEYQRWGEIDFVVVSPQGLVAIEVKGGHVTCFNGIWRFESRYQGVVEKNISPPAQASRAYFSLLENHLAADLGEPIAKAAPSGFCVIYAGMTRQDGSALVGAPDSPAPLIGFLESISSSSELAAFLSGVIKYWRAKTPRPTRRWTPEEVAKVLGYLRPTFDRVAPLSIALSKIREEQYSLTRDQYRLLDFSASAPRIVCLGGAGSGKTFMAAECYRREQANNPLLVCGTEQLAEYLRASNVPNPARIVSFEELLTTPNEKLPKCGMLIVDEGQQVTSREALGLFGRILEGGMENGRWRWFSDPFHQVSGTSAFDPSVQARLVELGLPCTLNENCRNTSQILFATGYMSGVSLGPARVKGNGPDVIYSKASERTAQVEEAGAQIRRWLDDPSISSGQIALLSPKPLSESSIPAIARVAGIPYRSWHAGWESAGHYPREACVSTIEEFRGLEAPFVVLCDLNENTRDVDRAFYLGMTRANFGLFVMCDHALRLSAAQRLAKGSTGRGSDYADN